MDRPFLSEKSDLKEQDLINQENKLMDLLQLLMQKSYEFNCTIRTIGSIAVRIKASEYSYIQYRNKRFIADFDFVTYSKDIIKVQDMFFSLGWTEDQGVLRLFGDKRRIFYHPDKSIHCDIFLDKLRFCHEIDLKKRLEIDNPTISLNDLILAKLQIVEINKKDLVDIMTLFRKYEISVNDQNSKHINGKYLATLCGRDWGWWKTVTTNLHKIIQFSSEYMDKDDAIIVQQRSKMLLGYIKNQGKSLKWKIRAMFGESFKWYNEVEEIHR